MSVTYPPLFNTFYFCISMGSVKANRKMREMKISI